MREKLRLRQAVLVEGRYDAAKLADLVEATILTTDGFAIYKDKEKQALLKRLGRQQGLIVLTDSDAAGFQIRRFVTDIVGAEFVRQAYVPALPGKEKRKAQPGKEGLLGVEGVPTDQIVEGLRLVVQDEPGETAPAAKHCFTYAELYELGLSGGEGSAAHRRRVMQALGLPPRLSKKALCQVLGQLYSYEEVQALAEKVARTEK